MHGTGTPLGDPIEICAAIAVLQPLGGIHTRQLLGVLASKSSVGHGEPAAGMIGFAFAAASLQHRAAAPVLHLRTLNPHVQSGIDGSSAGWTGKGPANAVAISRSAAPMSLQSDLTAVYSVSSFAFQVCIPGNHSEFGKGNVCCDILFLAHSIANTNLL